MVEVKPVLFTIEPWDALKGTSVYFSYTGSKQALENELIVTDLSDNQIVYGFTHSSFERVHHLPPNHFVNGKIYSAKVRVKASDGTYSPYSNEVQFRTFKTPVLDIISIDGQGYVYNRDVTFEALYTQEDNEIVKSYRFKLYDESEDLVRDYPVRFPQNTNELVEDVKELEKGKGYFIECLIETVNGLKYSHRERFIPMYIVPSINGVISTKNDHEEGFIRITANLKQITGTQIFGMPVIYSRAIDNDATDDDYDSDNYEYIDNEWIVIPKDKPVMFKGLGMNRASDFVMKVWCKNIPNGTKFLELSPDDDKGIPIEFWKYEDRIVAVKRFNGAIARYCSNIVTIPVDVAFMLYVKTIEHRIDLSIQVL